MVRSFNAETFQVTFEERHDLSPEYDVVKPDGFRYGFELPKNVDFYIHLGRHVTRQDFEQTKTYIEELEPDLLLLEAGTDEHTLELLEYAYSDDPTDFKIAEALMMQFCPANRLHFNLAALEASHKHHLKIVPADPPQGHKSYTQIDTANSLWDPDNPNISLAVMKKSVDERDDWLLNNIKKLVDKNTDKSKLRRCVVLFRGNAHFRLLRALEHQIETNPIKANGSEIVSSVVELISRDGQAAEDIMFR